MTMNTQTDNQTTPESPLDDAACSPSVEEFLRDLYASNKNRVEGDSDVADLFGKDSPFRIICTKCGSQDISILGQRGIDYGGETGYSPGSTVIKCHGCGAAMSAWS